MRFRKTIKKISNYWGFIERQDKKTVINITLSALGLLLAIAFVRVLPFKEVLFDTLFPKQKVIAVSLVPQYIQSAVASPVTVATALTTAWPLPTTAGNLLVATLTIKSTTPDLAITPPSNWTQVSQSNNGANLYQWVYYYPNAPSQSGDVTFSVNNSVIGSLVVAEYKDVEKVNPFDTKNTTTGSGTSATGIVTTTNADEFIIAAISADANIKYASPSAGFTLAAQASTSTGTDDSSTGVMHYFSSSSGQMNNSIELDAASSWINTSLAFKAAQILVTPTPTVVATAAPTPISTEWTQDAHDAQRTGYSPVEPSASWSLAWRWNGSDSNGGTGSHFYDAPKEARTITGGGNVYVPAGSQGLYALTKSGGTQVWNVRTTSFNATAAYDSGFVYAGGVDGNLYKIDVATGSIQGTYNAASPINKAVLLVGSYAYVVTDNGQLHKVDTSSMTRVWLYPAGSSVATLPTYSASRDAIIYATDDLFVHAVNNNDGSRKWRVKPTPNNPGDPAFSGTTAGGASLGNQFELGWPVIAEQHGIVFVRMQLPHDAMPTYPSVGGIFPNDLATTRTWLQNNAQNKNLFALNLDDGTEKFIPAVGYGSTEDWITSASRPYGVMGSQPVVKIWPDGKEVAYIHFRNGQSNPPDYRWDGHMGEMVLDDQTVPGLVAGDLRFVRMNRRNGYGGPGYTDIIDEQNPLTLAGDTIFHSHWAALEGVKITDRSNSKGLTYASPIETTKHPPIMRAMQACGTQNVNTHYTTCGMSYITDGGRFYDAPGFWSYWNVADPPGYRIGSGNTAGAGYSAGFLARYAYVVDGLMIVQGNGGDIMAFTLGSGTTPAPARTPTPTPVVTTPTPTSAPAPTASPLPPSGGAGTTTATFTVNASASDVNEDGLAYTATDPTLWLGTGASTTASFAGLHFANVTIPQDATISSARLQVYSTQNQWIQHSFSYNAEASDNSRAFSTTSKPSQRIVGTQSVAHSSSVQWLANTSYTLDEIAPVIQEVVNRSDWSSANSLSLILKGTGSAYGRKLIQSYNGSAVNAPKLIVTYTTGTPSAPTPTPAPTYTISGNLYNDVNRNGAKDVGETNYAGATITIQGAASRTVTTDTSGNYSFTNLAGGFYGVSLTVPALYEATTTNPVNTTISSNTTINFGIALSPTATPGGATGTPTTTPASTPVDTATFTTGKAGYVDGNPRQIVRASNDRMYMFASVVQTPRVLKAYWSNPGLPASAADISGTTQVSTTSELISADAVYDGSNIIHVLINDMSGTVRDYPFDTSSNTFSSPITIATGAGTPGSYTDIGTVGVSGMYDKTNTLHVAYWTSTNQIIYRSYTYSSSTNTLNLLSGPTRLDSSGGANHPQVVVSPVDNSITVSWVNGQSGAGAISARTISNSGTLGSIEQVSTGAVWTSPNSGINIDQGPSLVITSDGTKHLIYMENFGSCGTDYGRIHYVKKSPSDTSWIDQSISNFCSHAPGLATNSGDELYIFGHGHPSNPSCTSMLDMCYVKRNTNGTWTNPVLFKAHPASDSLDASVSVKWGVVGWNRPETIEILYFAALNGSYQNTEIYYGRIAGTALPTPTPTYNLSGNVFLDSNQNGAKDIGESGYSGATVSVNTTPVQNATTASSGNYTFTSLPAATYAVTLTLPAGYIATTTNPASVALGANTTQNFGIVQSQAPQVQNVTTLTAPSSKYTKAEWVFDLSKTYVNPYYYYDATDTAAANPTNMTWVGEDGISVDMNLTSPSGKTIKVPAFWMEDYTRVRNSGFQVLGKRDNGRWHVRFTPSEAGTYQYYITAQDKTGTGRLPASDTQSFTVTDSTKKGFVRTSSTDSRFLAYDDGSSFVPIPAGRQWWHGNEGGLRSYAYEDLFNTYFGPNKVNLVRIWDQADFSLSVEGAQPVWIREGFANPGAALGTEIGTSNVLSGLRAASPSTGQGWYQRLSIAEPSRSHKLMVWMKTASTADQAQVNVRAGTLFNSGTVLGQVTSNSQAATAYTQYSVTFTPNNSATTINLLRSAGTGNIYIDDIAFGPVDGLGNIEYNIVSDADFERHFAKDTAGNDPNANPTLPRPLGNFFNPWSSYELDKIIESAESNGVTIQLCSCSGPWFTWPANDPNLAEGWALKSWQRNFRYRVARWGYSPAVLAWEKHNEHGNVPAGSDIYNFYQSYGSYQKNIDPYGHLRTTSQGSQAFSPGLWSSAGLDLANYHDYMMISRYPASLTNDAANFVYSFGWCLRNPATAYCQGLTGDGSSWSGSAKPWVWGELDVGTSTWDQGNPATANGEGRLRFLRNSLWAGLFSPLGTAGLDWYWDNEDTATRNAKYAQRKVASDFFAGVDYHRAKFIYIMTSNDVPNGYSGETVTSSNSTARIYAMRREDKQAAYAWIQNRNNTWATSPTVPTAISTNITIGNLLNTDSYKVEVWNTSTGAIISTTNQTPSVGNITFTVSNLTSDVAVKIESAGIALPPATTPGPSSSPTAAPSIVPSPSATPTPTPVPTYALTGAVYVDTNSNGAKDVGETGYSGATITLSGGATTTTNASGDYSFSNLSAASYTITLTAPAGYITTTTNPAIVALAANTTVNFGIALSPTAAPVDGDASNDGTVNLDDIKAVLQSWGVSLNNSVDQFKDGLINSLDFAHVRRKQSSTSSPTPAPVATATPVASTSEWTQFGYNSQRTNFTTQTVTTPWKYKWQWNGADNSGKLQPTHQDVPDLVQPITGGGRVYMIANNTLYALDKNTGNILWTNGSIGTLLATPIYDNEQLYVASGNGLLYKLNATNGFVIESFAGASALNVAPLLVENTVYAVSQNGILYAVDKNTMGQIWQYTGGSLGATAPAYSPSRRAIVYLTQDLFVHAVNITDGTRKWRVKPTSRSYQAGNPTNTGAQAENGWPVIAEQHGIVFVRYRLDWDTLWTWNPFPTTLAQIRTNLASRLDQQTLFALNLDTGTTALLPLVGNGGAGDGGYLPMGPQPVIRTVGGQEVAYIIWRNGQTCAGSWCDGREDATIGEMVLDNTTVPGYSAGDVRFVRFIDIQTDEMMNLTMSSDTIFHSHWLINAAKRITNRSSTYGDTFANPIQTSDAPNVIWRQVYCPSTNTQCNPQIFPGGSGFTYGSSDCPFDATSRYCRTQLYSYGDNRSYPPGFYEYHNDYNSRANSTPFTVISDGLVLVKTNDGAIIALENGNPLASAGAQSTTAQNEQPSNVLSANAETISWEEADNYVGQNVTVEGVIKSSVDHRPKAIYLGFKNPHDGALLVRIFEKDISKFNYDLSSLRGKKVKITGFISLYWPEGKDPEITVSDPKQIEIIK